MPTQEGARALRNEITEFEKATINEERDFAVGKNRKRTAKTEHGDAEQTLKRRTPTDEFEKKKSRGRPKSKTEALPRKGLGVDWEEIAKSHGVDS